MEQARVRYIVNDVDAAVPFYRDMLGFEVQMHPGPGFAMLARGPLVLMLNRPGAGGAGTAAGEGETPAPGGWNRLQLVVPDLQSFMSGLEGKGARFRTSIVQGQGGRQALVEDPSGNLVELFEPAER
jgi:catechol 2,3-dioxygenase-like lactoylglutathione lyase family enzyme